MLRNVLALTIKTLTWIEQKKLSERLALTKAINFFNIQDRAIIKWSYKLVCETVKRQNLLDKFINLVVNPRTLDEFDPAVKAFLRLYVYKTKLIPTRSGIELREATYLVKQTRRILSNNQLLSIEGFLGTLLTRKVSSVFNSVTDTEKTGLLTFHPTWFVHYCYNLLGRVESLKLLKANMLDPIRYLRLNTLISDETSILKKLIEDRITVQKVKELTFVYELIHSDTPILSTPSFQKHLFSFQDKASCYAVEAAEPKLGMTVIDVCAAPGSKSSYLTQLMRDQGEIYSIDYSKRRITILKNETAKIQTTIVMPLIADVREPLPLQIQADVLMLDPPCTGTGTFNKFPSAKWRITQKSIDKMADIQWKMLTNCVDHVKLNGFLIYSTCSITLEENEMIVQKLLERYPNFSLENIHPSLGTPGLKSLSKCRRLYPHTDRCNGFFLAKFLKRES